MTSISWDCLSQTGPSVAYHTGALIGHSMYVHGGITRPGSTEPTNQFHKFDLQTTTWTNLTDSNSPYLSHHASVVIGESLILIGGWNGKCRCSDIHIYNSGKNKWVRAQTSGFPQGAGLSSHTAIALVNDDILVIGREGSLRTQRRSGNSFLIKGNHSKAVFQYSCYPISVSSRSGHSTNGLGNRVIVLGGRDDHVIEQHGGFKSTETECDLVTKLSAGDKFPNVAKFPSRKNHIAISGKNCLFVHGGETFDGRNRNPVGEMFLVNVKPNFNVRTLGLADICRTGHVACANSDWLIIHGGLNERNLVQNGVYKLVS